MLPHNGVLAWSLAHGLAQVCGASFGFTVFWLFTRSAGEAHGAGVASLQLLLMLVAGLVQGALLGFLPGQVLVKLLSEADFKKFVRNTTFAVAGLHVLGTLPLTSTMVDGVARPVLGSWTLACAGMGMALLLGPLQARALSAYGLARRYALASVVAQFLGLLLERFVQAEVLPSLEHVPPAIALRQTWVFAQGCLVALPTGCVVVSMSRA
jgi:hypothetical protein